MLNEIDIKEEVIKLIAGCAVERGITLLGGIAGVGKTLTATATIDYIKDNGMFPADRIFSINTFAEKAAGSDINISLKDLSAKHAPDRILVVLDEICYENSAEIAIWLAEQGHSVFGVTQAYPKQPSATHEGIGLSSIIMNTVVWVDEENKAKIVKDMLDNLNLLILQDSLLPTHHRALKLTSVVKQQLLETLENQSLYKLYLSIDDLKPDDK